jgi:hypothetical protein
VAYFNDCNCPAARPSNAILEIAKAISTSTSEKPAMLQRTKADDDLGDDGLAVEDLTNDRLTEGKVFILFLVRKLNLYGSVLFDSMLQHTWLSLFICKYYL